MFVLLRTIAFKGAVFRGAGKHSGGEHDQVSSDGEGYTHSTLSTRPNLALSAEAR
jgi:hypothetical protein